MGCGHSSHAVGFFLWQLGGTALGWGFGPNHMVFELGMLAATAWSLSEKDKVKT